MVKRSKKSKSKRVSLKKKYKIIKKVKEHHKKKAKEAKKLGFNKKAKVEKDPGIPNDWPFKEQELKALEERRERSIKELEEKKTARKARAEKRKFGQLEDEKMDTIVEESTTVDSVVTKTYDHSERAFYKELVKVIDNSDVILEILDARDPLGTRCVDMEKMVIKSGAHKHIVLVLNKIDLVPRESAEKWLKYFREELPAVAFKCSTQEQKSNLGWKSTPKFKKTGKSGNTGNTSNLLQTSDCLGGESLLKLLQSYSKSHGIKKSITVGVIGLPNVGKSSLINSMKRTRVVNVGATPGLTRSMQEVQLLDNVKLLDCPGVVMLKSAENDASVALRNCKRIEKLEDPVAPVKQILTLCPESVLVTLYKIPSFKSVDDFIQKVATVRGKLKKGGIADVEATARIVLHDWNEGKIPYFTMPPSRNASDPADAKIVNELGKEFNVEEFYKESSFIGSLKSVDDFNHPVEVPANSPFNFDMTLLENDEQKKAPTVDNAGDEVMETKEDDASVTVSEDKFSNKGQNKKLYAQQGILNPKLKKAEKKRRKKGNQASAMEDGDYDFKVDYVRDADADASMEDVAQEKNENRFDLPSGVELDNE